jgi:hypothetical protein
MTKFEQLHAKDATALLCKMVEIITCDGSRGIREYTQATGQTPHELWRDICAEAGLDECEPWDGYPEKALALETIEKIPVFDAPSLLDPADEMNQLNKMTVDLLRMWKHYKVATERDKN